MEKKFSEKQIKRLKKLLKSRNWEVRAEVARKGYRLEKLVYDKEWKVSVIAFEILEKQNENLIEEKRKEYLYE